MSRKLKEEMSPMQRKRRRSTDLNPPARDKLNDVKKDICILIGRIQFRNGYSQKVLGHYMGTSQSNASLVMKMQVEELTINQLFKYLVRLEP
jgi:predicted XRE-type DNA-binding protein